MTKLRIYAGIILLITYVQNAPYRWLNKPYKYFCNKMQVEFERRDTK